MRKFITAALICFLLIMLGYLCFTENLDIERERPGGGFYFVQQIQADVKEEADAPLGMVKEYIFRLKETENINMEHGILVFLVKHAYVQVFIEEEPDDTTEEKLPQTGQMWWPVPIMISMGLLFILAGLIRRKHQ